MTDKKPMKVLSLKDAPREFRAELLKALGFGVDADGRVTKDGGLVLDRYVETPVSIDNMMILPGKDPVVLDDNILSLTQYLDENEDVTFDLDLIASARSVLENMGYSATAASESGVMAFSRRTLESLRKIGAERKRRLAHLRAGIEEVLSRV